VPKHQMSGILSVPISSGMTFLERENREVSDTCFITVSTRSRYNSDQAYFTFYQHIYRE
jgi:DNA phosphorothioation-dependent restriction protein DptG